MKVHDCIQGTRPWLDLRAGVPTSSEFDRITSCHQIREAIKRIEKGITDKPVKLLEGSETYMNELLAERMLREPQTKAVTMWMQRGSEHEAEAVSYYEMARGVDTDVVGFCTNDEGTIGASPDRLVGEDGLLEIKVPCPAIHVGYLRSAEGAGDDYRIQAMGQLWITGRQWVDIMSYNPGMPEALVRFERDEVFIGMLASAVTEFSARLEAHTAKFRELGWIKDPEPEQIEDYDGHGITDEDAAFVIAQVEAECAERDALLAAIKKELS
tara:strand:+ start:804 stop:1610 length:807 start_codon:yes stop_codon:yes gene_type:complete